MQIQKEEVSRALPILLLFTLTFTPVLLIPNASDYFNIPKLVFLTIVTALMLFLDICFMRSTPTRRDSLYWLLLVYLGLLCLSTAFSQNPLRSIFGSPQRRDGLLSLLVYGALFLLVRKHYRYDPRHFKWILLSAGLLAVYGIAQHFGLDPIPRDSIREGWGIRPFATFGNPDFFGAYLCMMLLLLWYAYVCKGRWYVLAVAALLFVCFIFVATRSAWVGFLVAALLLGILTFRLKLNKKALLISTLVFFSLFIVLDLCYGSSISERLLTIATDLGKVVTKADGYEGAGAGRIFIWQRYWQMICQRPWLGYGPEMTGEVFTDLFSDEILQRFNTIIIFDKAHNEYLHLAATSGIPCLLVYLAFLFICFWRGLCSLWLKKTEPRAAMVQGAAWVAAAAYAVQAAMNISVVSVAYVFWILLGVVASQEILIKDTQMVNAINMESNSPVEPEKKEV